MANRRMFSLQIVDTDAFMDMPLSTQALYFHLGMRADDDGFVSNAKRIQKLVGASDDDLKLLLLKRFILAFESGVIVIKHWRISNYIQKDRYHQTLYIEEKATLFLKPDGAYTDHPSPGAKPCLPTAEAPETPEIPELPAPQPNMDTDCIQAVSEMDTEVRLGKDRLEVELGEDRLEIGEDKKINNISGGDCAREEAEKEVDDFLIGRDLSPDFYFGITAEVKKDVELLTAVIFKRFATRQPTDIDRANVFMALRCSHRDEATGQWTITLPQDRKDLLMYAFETAASAGKPGDWNYINGVLEKLAQRGIRTLRQAEDFDYERKGW